MNIKTNRNRSNMKNIILMLALILFTLFQFSGCSKSSGGGSSEDGVNNGLVEDNTDNNSDSVAGVVYVNASSSSGTENGQSWPTAYKDLSSALANVSSGEEIWVSKGTYYPSSGTDRSISFNLVSNVAVYGGFLGSETSRGQRDWNNNETILSGDIGIIGNNSDNSYHVVVGIDNSIIDGFIIEYGNANKQNDDSGVLISTNDQNAEILRIVTNVRDNSGAGLLNVHASTITKNCTFRYNTAAKGGAVYNMVTKEWNPGPGGSINIGDAPYFENCLFHENSASGRGGAVNSDFFTSPTFVSCKFIKNHCDSKGGAVYNDMGAPSYFINVLFAENTAERGSALVADGSSSHRFAYCSFINNSAQDIGAALYQGTYMGNSMTSGSSFLGNEVHAYNSIIIGNENESTSTSISNWHDDSVIFDDVSIVEKIDGSFTLSDYVNSSTYESLSSEYGWQSSRSVDKDYWINFFQSDLNSTFIDHSFLTTATGSSGSIIYVKSTAAGLDNGSSWINAYTDLVIALNNAGSGSEIWVATGTYKPGTTRDSSFVMKENVNIYGGFDGVSDDERTDQNPDVNTTILSGDIGVQGDLTDNSYHVVFGASNSTIDGFTIEGGYADGKWHQSRGGGVYLSNANSPVINNCVLKNNYGIEGAAISAYYNSAPTISNCTISSNKALRGGAVLFRTGPDTKATGAKISDTRFESNTASDRGGAVYIDYGAWPTFTDCVFISNTSLGNGGAVYVDNNSSQLSKIETWFENCTFESNESSKRGGAFSIYEGIVYINNSLISLNTASTGGGGIALDYKGSYNADTSTVISSNTSIAGENDIDDDSTGFMNP